MFLSDETTTVYRKMWNKLELSHFNFVLSTFDSPVCYTEDTHEVLFAGIGILSHAENSIVRFFPIICSV